MKKMLLYVFLVVQLTFYQMGTAYGQEQKLINNNKPEREEWLKDAGFGMFIHWGIDTQLGTVISHSLAGSSPAYARKYIEDLPKTFNPKDWDPEKIVTLAKNAGMKYIVFTTKHHSGFCFWDTKTTDFSVKNTPYQKDILQDFVAACRKFGLAVGFYYSSEDFVYSFQNGIQDIRRVNHWEAAAPIQEKYRAYVMEQTRELMTDFGAVDIFFIDSKVLAEEVKAVVWELQPDCLITRGAILTPEQFIPGEAINSAWESNMTMGTQWNYKPTNEHYKSGGLLIKTLIEARAKGGTFLLNIGPNQWGELNEAQQGRLMELAAWNFVNHEAIQNVRPWITSNEGNIWFTKQKDQKTVFAYLTDIPNWVRGNRKDFLLKSVKATRKTRISVLGQSGNVVEYMPDVDGTASYEQTPDGLKISVVRAQRIYNNHQWPNPVVVKLENVTPAMTLTKFKTSEATVVGRGQVKFGMEIPGMGDASSLQIGFEYRPLRSTLEKEVKTSWSATNLMTVNGTGAYELLVADESFRGLSNPDDQGDDGIVNASASSTGLEYRAIVYQNGLKIEGNTLAIKE
ncbi:alpha-L-fucosidase [Fulvivirgaceae bacterium BMA12]|uniref:alpha-L-fucosidase n=1 Tax=Agaribacillus aureus TaxID=3051825 RepID=A0ABT8LBQ8_9BACT|nr:alpha-L-fucosidase [Fulvivirgaceae bacterium BMA12]